MNENTFQSQRTHTRIKFEPLDVSCQLVCITPQSPAAQSVNTLLNPVEYEPDRGTTPTVVLPDVRATDPDNVFHHGSANEFLSLASMAWFVDDEPIAYVWTAGTDYDIVTAADDTRGALRIYKNLSAGQRAVIHFKGQFLDWRTGTVYDVESDDMPLSCTDKGENAIQCSVDKPLIEYDPLFDDLLLYDYKVAHGITVSGTRDSYKNGKCFEQTVNIILTSGLSRLNSLPAGMTMRLCKLGSNTPIVPLSDVTPATQTVNNPEVISATFPNIVFDMRMIGKAEYEVQFVKNSVIEARATIGLHTKTTMPVFGKPLHGADIAAAQTEYRNKVLLNLADRMIEYPELYYLIEWFTQAKYNDSGTWRYSAAKTWQLGENLQAAVADLGIGLTVNDSFFDLWFDVNPHEPRELCLDHDGTELLDENNEPLID